MNDSEIEGCGLLAMGWLLGVITVLAAIWGHFHVVIS